MEQISYVSALSNMEGGSIVMGVKDKTLDIVDIELLSKNRKGLTRKDIDSLLLDMVPKFSKNPSSYIGNLLSEMKDKDHSIYLDNNR